MELKNTLGELLEDAINDACSLDPELYSLSMTDWHCKYPSQATCSVCMAGAVIARSLGADRELDLSPAEYPREISDKLLAINALRKGYTHQASCYIGKAEHRTLDFNHPIRPFEIPCAIFQSYPWHNNWAAHRAYAAELKRLGL